ncbi:MAG: hypothetical protein R6W73_08170 [Candidatus Saliniplasma sp.]
MEAKDITSENTRKEMNSISVQLGIDEPKAFPNKNKLAEEMIEVIRKQGYEEELEEKTKRVKELLRKCRETKLDLSGFKNGFKEMRNAKGSYDIPKALDLADDLIEKGEILIEIKNLVDDVREKLNDIEQKEIKSRYRDRLKKLIEGLNEGEHRSTEEGLRNLLEEIEDEYRLKQKLEERFSVARKRLSKLRKIDADIEKLKMLVNGALRSRKRGEFRKGLEKMDEFLDQSEMMLIISDMIRRCNSNIRELKKNDLDVEQYIRELQTAKEKADSADYQYSIELLRYINTEMEDDLDEVPEAGIGSDSVSEPISNNVSKQDLQELHDKLDEVEDALKEVRNILNKTI